MTKFVLTILLLYVGFDSFSQQSNITRKHIETLEAIATADVPSKSPGVASAIINGADVAFEIYRGYGYLADSVLLSGRSRFNIASNGKQFTAFAILILESEKKFSLDDDIRKYFPEILPDSKHAITIESLLNHSSGIRDIYDLLALQGITWWKQTMSNADVLKILSKQRELNFVPGSDFLYSNSNYILLSLLVEKVSGKSFVEYTRGMFHKLNMPGTSFEDDYRNIRGQVAQPYFNFSTWSNYKWIWNATGDGNLFSTLPDLIQWEKIVNGSAKCAFAKNIIRRSQQLTDNKNVRGYGFGLEFRNYRGYPIIYHEGATGAWKAVLIRIPEKKQSFITLTNSGKVIPSDQTFRMVDAFLDLKSEKSFIKALPDNNGPMISDDDILGTFTDGQAFYFQFLKKEEMMYLRRHGRNDVALERESANVFRQLYDSTFKQKFTRQANGDLEVTAYHPTHEPYSLSRKTINWDNFNLSALVGDFDNTETGTTISIREPAQHDYPINFGDKSTTGTLVSPHNLIVNSYNITFDPSDTIKTIFVNGDRIRNVRYVRRNVD